MTRRCAPVAARLLFAAAVVEAFVFAAALGISNALCDTDKLVWGAFMAVSPLLFPLGILASVVAVALASFALARTTSRFGWRRTLSGIAVASGAVFGLSWMLSAAFGVHGCSMLI